ncbi:hypothetical protein A3193_18525 [Candidatus Thiodiazotropha endoloripes]|uniref:hypothetical protein n=1 Tax=Candidatus Thiodiazotropha endoloripes TaxID=1818881 RepID=UPI00083E14AA|nr:hypothetical protein [Candidatus Thiodiazotropha endoloripes]ODB82745.1 hypothetical protein A3193_18525 [Candidatus Thiodiazotropha endoloripes]
MTDNSKINGLLSNPMFLMGMGLLGSGGNRDGLLTGLNLAARFQNNDINRQLAQAKINESKHRMNQPSTSKPLVREFIEGDKRVMKQWDTLRGEWVTISEGPRWNPNAGMQLNVGPDGGVQFAQGRPLELTNTNRNKVQEKQFNVMEQLERLNAIEQAFKPDFQRFSTRAGAAWTSTKEKAGFGTTPQEQKELSEMATFKTHAITNLNATIKEASGATVTEQESKRLTAAMPNPGLGVFDGDSPTEFQAKLEAVTSELRKAAMRYQYAQTHGLKWQNIPLNNMGGLIDKRGAEIEAQFLKQGMSAKEAERRAIEQVRREFGL